MQRIFPIQIGQVGWIGLVQVGHADSPCTLTNRKLLGAKVTSV